MNITILTGAGISAESGIRTFRDTGGLWVTKWCRAAAISDRRSEISKEPPRLGRGGLTRGALLP